MVIIYRDYVSSNSFFELVWSTNGNGSIWKQQNFWGYKIYAGSSYNFIKGWRVDHPYFSLKTYQRDF